MMNLQIDNEDIYAYMLRKKGLSGRLANKLCKLNISFDNILKTDFDYMYLDNIMRESNESVHEEKDLIKLENIKESVLKEEDELREEAKIFYANLLRNNIRWTHLNKKDYPFRLKNIGDPPLMLFYRGKLPDEQRPCVAIVGARECSPYGEKTARMFARELSSVGVQIISGMARGVDGISQRGSISAGGNTFGVLGCGVDVIYPVENKDLFDDILKDGGILSEFDPGTEPLRTYFPSRNRIISGLSDIVLVVEARKRSGTYITVTQALDQGREVFAVPGRITDALSDGCNNLIAAGAGIAVGSQSIIEDLRNKGFKYIKGSFDIGDKRNERHNADKKEGDNLMSFMSGDNSKTDGEKTGSVQTLETVIYDMLLKNEMSLDAIYQALGDKYSIEDLSISLVELEMDGKIIKTGSRYFALS
ncbi:MAG: DNA-processing protein DprA [Lachnospiraceae bacterium]|nr:DNA-processing protein DprA [Lachnospiraceae bacterium]